MRNSRLRNDRSTPRSQEKRHDTAAYMMVTAIHARRYMARAWLNSELSVFVDGSVYAATIPDPGSQIMANEKLKAA